MARPLRIDFEGAWQHVMNRGAGRLVVFRSRRHRKMFLRLLGEIVAIYRIELHAFCLMDTHYHLLVRTPNAGLGRAMRHLDGVYTQRFNRDVGTDGSLFRGRYKSVLVADDFHLCNVNRYIHLNPVDASIVEIPEAYAFSSYRAYLGLEIAPWWLSTAEILGRFAPGDARLNYRQFVESGIDEATRAFYSRARLRPVLGSDDFRKLAEQRARATGAHLDQERPGFDLLSDRPGLDMIGDAVCRAFRIPPAELRPAARRRVGCGAARGAVVLLGRNIGGHSLQAIATWLGYRKYAAASRAMARLEAETAGSPELLERLEIATRILDPAQRVGELPVNTGEWSAPRRT